MSQYTNDIAQKIGRIVSLSLKKNHSDDGISDTQKFIYDETEEINSQSLEAVRQQQKQ
jgi:hypothetical protein